jgi:hypothetical protein
MLDVGGRLRLVFVLGAEYQEWAYLDDLTTAGTRPTGHTSFVDQFGLHAKDTHNPTGVPGLQIDGYFRDESETTKQPGNFYGNRRFPHDSQFVIRLPNDWNRKLVVTGPSGVRGQYANDFIIGDFALKKGYAYASTDKGNSGLRFYCDDRQPGDAIAEWHRRVSQLAVAAKGAAATYYESPPLRTYITGISNGGYLTRYALENTPELYNGGVDWEGVFWGSEGPNLLTFLPTTLKYYPEYKKTGNEEARKAIIEAGFTPDSEFLWDYHYNNYWGVTQRIYREEFDPTYLGAEAEYDYSKRPQEVKDAVARVSLSGQIGKPLITLHGTLDALLPKKTNTDTYTKLVEEAGRSHLHRCYTIEGGTHVDSLYDDPKFRDKLRPILPCYRACFEALEKWVEEDTLPPENQSVPRPEEGEVANSCAPL